MDCPFLSKAKTQSLELLHPLCSMLAVYFFSVVLENHVILMTLIRPNFMCINNRSMSLETDDMQSLLGEEPKGAAATATATQLGYAFVCIVMHMIFILRWILIHIALGTRDFTSFNQDLLSPYSYNSNNNKIIRRIRIRIAYWNCFICTSWLMKYLSLSETKHFL